MFLIQAQKKPDEKPASKDKRRSQSSKSTPQKRASTSSNPAVAPGKKSPADGGVMPAAGGGPGVGPTMKLRDNPAMAMTLAQSLPPGRQEGMVTNFL